MRIGKLIPSDDYVNIVLPFLSQPHLADSPLFLSSIGRWHGEEDSVIKALKKSNHPLKAVIYLNISNADSYNRWLIRETFADRQNRHDDTKEVLEIRLCLFPCGLPFLFLMHIFLKDHIRIMSWFCFRRFV